MIPSALFGVCLVMIYASVLLPHATRNEDVFASTCRANHSLLPTVAAFKLPSELKIEAWTWNTNKKDLSEETEELFNRADENKAHVVVVALQEATTIVTRASWLEVARGVHWGRTTSGRNSQVLQVFLKPEHWDWKGEVSAKESPLRNGVQSDLWRNEQWPRKEIINNGKRTGMFFQTKIIETSRSGKGGLATEWTVPDMKRIWFICAHAQAGGKEGDATTRDEHLEKYFLIHNTDNTDGMVLKNPQDKEYHQGKYPHVFLIGDLNERFLKERTEDEASTPMCEKLWKILVDRSWTEFFLKADTLTWYTDDTDQAYSEDRDQAYSLLIVPIERDGWGYTCGGSSPDAWYQHPPTYKMASMEKKGNKCEKMAKLWGWKDPNRDPRLTNKENAKFLDACEHCLAFGGEDIELKGDSLQLGKLDRICYPSTTEAVMHIDIRAGPGTDHSDHMGISGSFRLQTHEKTSVSSRHKPARSVSRRSSSVSSGHTPARSVSRRSVQAP